MKKEQIVEAAKKHGGRYLLVRRYREPEPWMEKDGLDREYDECEKLAKEGRAEWLPWWSIGAPGIRLCSLERCIK